MIRDVYIGATSACFELENEAAYYAPETFDVFLNGERQFACDTNVFSLFTLSIKALLNA